MDGDANMTVGTYTPSLERLHRMAHTHSYMQNSFVFAFAENVEYSSSIARLLQPFRYKLWTSIGILLSTSMVVILLSKKLPKKQRHFIIGGKMNRTPIMNMWNAIIGNVIPNPRMTQLKYFSSFARILCVLWIMFWLVVRNSYQGALYEFLQSQRVISTYDTIEKVRLSNARIHIISTAVSLIPDDFDRRRLETHLSQLIYTPCMN